MSVLWTLLGMLVVAALFGGLFLLSRQFGGLVFLLPLGLIVWVLIGWGLGTLLRDLWRRGDE